MKPGGQDIAVTEENKREYVKLIVRHRLLHGIVDQVVALKRGFNEIVPKRFMEAFDERDLELIICGLGEVDVGDWSKHTEYRNCSPDDELVRWFWQAVGSFSNEMRARVLQFATGTSRVPVTGFADLRGSSGPKKFTIEVVPSMEAASLPKAHTCFNRIDIPQHTSYEQLKDKLSVAVENTVGFGIE